MTFFLSVLVLCTQVNMMFVMLLWVYNHTGKAWKICLKNMLEKYWASIPKVVGSIPTVVRQAYFSNLPGVDIYSEEHHKYHIWWRYERFFVIKNNWPQFHSYNRYSWSNKITHFYKESRSIRGGCIVALILQNTLMVYEINEHIFSFSY
jgi:hypothetical protein